MRTRTLTVYNVKADLVNTLTNYAVDFNDIVDYVVTYNKSYRNFSIRLDSAYGLNKWYLVIRNLRTNNIITVDITKIVNKVK